MRDWFVEVRTDAFDLPSFSFLGGGGGQLKKLGILRMRSCVVNGPCWCHLGDLQSGRAPSLPMSLPVFPLGSTLLQHNLWKSAAACSLKSRTKDAYQPGVRLHDADRRRSVKESYQLFMNRHMSACEIMVLPSKHGTQ